MSPFSFTRLFFALFFVLIASTGFVHAQQTSISGRITDALTAESIPFANVYFKKTTVGTTANIDGYYTLLSDKATDTLIASYIGYNPVKLPVRIGRTQTINFLLKVNKVELHEVVIKPGENPAHKLLRKIIAHKDANNKDELSAYQYESYNKLEFDITNISEKMKTRRMFKPFAFIFDNMDSISSNEKPFLPVFISEALSDVYFKKPNDKKEIVRATKTSGLENQSVMQFLGDMYQNTNVYDNYINVFGKSFVSPINNNGLLFYRYYLVDSAVIDNKWCYKMTFKPRRPEELTFTGDMWVHDTTFAIKKISLRISPNANINFVNDIAMVKEYNRIKNEHWMLTKDILVVDFVPSKDGVGFIGRKSTSYKKFILNMPKESSFYSGQTVVMTDDVEKNKDVAFWQTARHDTLNKRERKIYAMVDTLKSLPIYQTYIDAISLIVSGYKSIGKLNFGPYFNIYSANPIEGSRFRLGIRTNSEFSTRLSSGIYGAYGTRDHKFKYGGDFEYLLTKKPRQTIKFSYKNDVEQLGASRNSFAEGNVLSSLLKRVTTDKYTSIEDNSLTYEREWVSGFYNRISLKHTTYMPLGSLDYSYYTDDSRTSIRKNIQSSEIVLFTHFGYRESFLSRDVQRASLGSKYPILEAQFVLGLKNLKSDFSYKKVLFRISDKVKIPPFGHFKYRIDAGKVFGAVPFPLLEVHQGNESYFYDVNAFNLMNYYEFVSDQFASLFLTQHFDGFFFDKLPLLKKLKWREVMSVRALTGSISQANRDILVNPSEIHSFTNNKPYAEAGLGIENIFKILRIDAIWRLSYLDRPDIAKFGIRANLQIIF